MFCRYLILVAVFVALLVSSACHQRMCSGIVVSKYVIPAHDEYIRTGYITQAIHYPEVYEVTIEGVAIGNNTHSTNNYELSKQNFDNTNLGDTLITGECTK